MNRRLVLVLALFAGGLVGGALAVHHSLYRDRITDAPPVIFRVERGESLRSIARRLQDAGLLAEPWRLRLVARLEGGGRQVRAGTHALPRGASPARLLEELVRGRILTRSVTLVEGWRRERSVAVLADSLSLDRARLDSLTLHPEPQWREEFSIPEGMGLEGYLFPETYRFVEGVDPRTVVRTLVDGVRRVFVGRARAQLDSLGWSIHQVLTLASIVEAEAVRDEERSRIAAVYHNRLRKGWRLEADPTVAYALGKEGQRLSFRDLEVDSAYNTYRVDGLPPGPINSPGRASIRAVLAPEPGFDAMYFVADGRGGHRFSRTWKEHRAAVEEYRRWQRRQRGSG